MKPLLSLYTFFHLNIAYSSIEEEQRPEVIRRCYWPMLKLAEKYRFPIGIEAPGYTLETINRIDPQWITMLRTLCRQGLVDFIGSGYAQIIGPLVPSGINAANLRIGNAVYQNLLRITPRIALINEQAFSAGLIQHYLDAGYQAIVMEWNNPARCHPEWNPEWRYFPQKAVGQQAEEIALVWNKSISFQKFQRYVHGEMELEPYVAYLEQHLSSNQRAFPLYGNDVEIFDFRPGRFHTEAKMHEDGEWQRINRLFARLSNDDRFHFMPIRDVLKLMDQPHAGHCLSLESPQHPIPVKKQEKYNITRWAVTGAHDLQINTECWKIYQTFLQSDASEKDWKELCYLWSSDFRTHITTKRLKNYLVRLEKFKTEIGQRYDLSRPKSLENLVNRHEKATGCGCRKSDSTNFLISQEHHFLHIESNRIKLILNCRRGMAIQSLVFKQVCKDPLCVSLDHGYYDDISMGADFYSGHLVLETPGLPKITDLEKIDPYIEDNQNGYLCVSGTVATNVGDINKKIELGTDKPGDAFVRISYQMQWKQRPLGSLRIGAVTLNPEAFDPETLFFATHNGGKTLERFCLDRTPVNHGNPASFLVSANAGLGVTEGLVVLGDRHKQISTTIDKQCCAALGMISYRIVSPNYFFRHVFSILEMDETSSREGVTCLGRSGISGIGITLTAQKKG
jgi:hypothetical protein